MISFLLLLRSRSGGCNCITSCAWGAVLFRLRPLRLAASTANRNVAEDTAFCPVTPATLAEVTGLREVVVVVVAEFRVQRVTSWAL